MDRPYILSYEKSSFWGCFQHNPVHFWKWIIVPDPFHSSSGISFRDHLFFKKKGGNLARQIFAKDSMSMNLRSPLPYSLNQSKRFPFVLLREKAMCNVYFLLLYSTSYNGVRLVLGIYQGGNLFVLAQMGIHYQYTQTGSRVSNVWVDVTFNSTQSRILSPQFTVSHSFLATRK